MLQLTRLPSQNLFDYLVAYLKSADWRANSEDPNQTPRFAASDLGVHCLPTHNCPSI